MAKIYDFKAPTSNLRPNPVMPLKNNILDNHNND